VHFLRCFDDISAVWNLVDRRPARVSFWTTFIGSEPNPQDRKLMQENSVKFNILEAILNRNALSHFIAKSLDIVGPADAPFAASDFAKVVAGITIIHDELFIMQQTQRRDNNGVRPLTSGQISEAIERYCSSKLRSVSTSFIDGESLLGRCYSKEAVKKITLDAITNARLTSPRTI
jgi:hypothetical protein